MLGDVYKRQLTARGQKRRSLGSILPYTVRKPQPHWMIADWLGLMKPACGESWPSRQRRGPAAAGEYKVPSLSNSDKPGTKTVIPRVDTIPNSEKTPTPPGGCRLGGAHGASASTVAARDNVEVSLHPGRIMSHIPGSEIIPYLDSSNKPGTKTEIPGLYRSTRCENPNPTG